MIVAAASMGGWVVARYAAGSGIESAWHDPVFGRSLVFYFFELPFYTGMVAFLETMAVRGRAGVLSDGARMADPAPLP